METTIIHESPTGPIILWGMYPHRGNEFENLKQAIAELLPDISCTLVAFQVEDWNTAFSPWQAECSVGSFAGGGAATLDFLVERVIPQLRDVCGKDRQLYIMGYSLAGLFALWVMYQTDLFVGAVCCSGSLWYPGFLEYIKVQKPFSNKHIYLSLGGKEANSKDALMATIADCTKEVERILKETNTVRLEMNPGGHFADAGKRLAKAVKWILD